MGNTYVNLNDPLKVPPVVSAVVQNIPKSFKNCSAPSGKRAALSILRVDALNFI